MEIVQVWIGEDSGDGSRSKEYTKSARRRIGNLVKARFCVLVDADLSAGTS